MTTSLPLLRTRQLDELLDQFRPLTTLRPPRQGWVQAIRSALGMTTAQLARRIGIAQSSLSVIERNEARGSITLGTLQKAAAALDCDVVYALVPRRSLQTTLEQQVREIVWKRVKRTAHTMALEDQAVSHPYLEAQVDEMVQQAMRKLPPKLWG